MLKQFLEMYQGYDAAEEADRKAFLYFLNCCNPDSVYRRDNLLGHLTASAWIINHARDKVLMAYHNIYQSWAWLGGHADGEKDLLKVAYQEAKEESSIRNINLVVPQPIEINICPVSPHIKNQIFVPAHLHYNVVYLFEGDENEFIQIKSDENSDVSWIRMSDVPNICRHDVVCVFYERIIKKVNDSSWLKK